MTRLVVRSTSIPLLRKILGIPAQRLIKECSTNGCESGWARSSATAAVPCAAPAGLFVESAPANPSPGWIPVPVRRSPAIREPDGLLAAVPTRVSRDRGLPKRWFVWAKRDGFMQPFIYTFPIVVADGQLG
jgi:hypothetical protein